VIRTVLRDVSPGELGTGAVLFHEHLSITLQRAERRQPVETILDLVKRAGQNGVSCIVDGSHADMGREMAALKAIAAQTNVHIIASGGYYTQQFYPAIVATMSEDQLAQELVRDANENRYGAFGEIGQLPNQPDMTPDERKVFRAVGKAHGLTGLPIFTHTPYGTGPTVPRDSGLRQLDVFESVGVNPARVAIGHTCCLDDPTASVFIAIARRGAFVGFDRVTYVQHTTDAQKVQMVQRILDAGFADRLLLSADFPAWRGQKAWVPTLEEGVGYERTVTVFLPMLRKAGVSDALIRQITIDNPRRFLSFLPRAG
jgi:phosphotriesterase-related protein